MKKTIFLSLILILSGCSDKKDASKSNFKEAINSYYAKNCIILYSGESEIVNIFKNKHGARWDLDKVKKYDFFTKLGYYEKTEINKKKIDVWSGSSKPSDVLEISFNLTKKGKDAFQNKGAYGSGFCAGNYKVTKVTNFTKPSNMYGYTISNVKFKSEVENIPEFTKSNDFKKVFKNFSYDRKPSKIILVLTENGWVSEKEATK